MIPPRSVMFGTEGKMSWIKAPAINVGMSKGKWTSSGVMLNGGAYELSSNYAHRKFDFAWNLMSPEEVRKITRYFDGVYGDELLYYLDPFAMNSNVLPLSWSVPMLAADDAPPLILDQMPTLSTVATNTNDLPVRAATYTLSAGYVSDTVFIPVPDGEGLNIGVVGSRTGTAAVTFTPKTGSAVSPTLTGIGSTNLITNYMTNTGGGVTVSLTGLGTITLVAMQARVSPNEVSVPSTTTNLFTNPSFETPFNNSKLSNWFTALAGTSPAQVIVIGDSISEGSGSSNVNLRWQTLAQKYLSPSGAVFPFIPAYPATGTGWPVVRTGTVAVNASWGLGFRTAILQDDAASLTFTFNGTSCKIMYTKASATGIMSITIDGGTPVLVNTNASSGGTSQAAIWSSGALTPGDHTVVIKRDTTSTAGQHPYIQGLLTYKGDETTGVRILDAAHSGWASQHYTTGTTGRIAYTSLALQAAGGAKLAIIEFGTNDPLYGTTGAQFRTNMENIIAGLRTGGFSGSVILLHMYKGNSVDETIYESYGAASEALAASDPNILYVNMRNFMPDVPTPFNAVSGDGMYADGLHPNDKGNRRISAVMLNIISNAVSGVTGGVQTAGWSADGSNSLRVFDEQTAAVSVSGPVVITARNTGQSATLAGTTVTSTSANQTLTLTGSGTLTLGAGWWDKLGDGITSWFSGATPSTGDTTYAWTGTANASTSTKTTSVPSPNAKQGFISGEGHSGLRLSGSATVSGYSAPSALNLQSISATLTEVGAWEPQ